MSNSLEGLEPKIVWSHFDAIRKIPRPSKHEERIAEHVRGWAESRGFEVLTDAIGNLIVKVPATPGTEGTPTLVLQSHLDMVPEKNADVDHDFMTDPIKVRVDGDWVRADGTTLGADNGIGVASAMAVAEDPDAVHGPLELLFTLDEETGLTGASQLDASLLDGRILLNLDTEEDSTLYIGCAGGADSTASFALERQDPAAGAVAKTIAVRGLKGGHSGVDIHENRANAVKLLARVLLAIRAEIPSFELITVDGGSKHNAIPREASATVRIPADGVSSAGVVVEEMEKTLKTEFAAIDPGLTITIEDADDARPLTAADRDRLLECLNAIPHGVLAMSREVPGLVETSNNLAAVHTADDSAIVTTSHRSSVMPALDATQDMIRSACALAGADTEVHDGYPGWKPDPDSEVVAKTVAAFEKAFGNKPMVKAVHAGLECGILLDKKPGMEAVSIGPEIRNPHSPDECVQISSVQRYYLHLKGVLAEYAG